MRFFGHVTLLIFLFPKYKTKQKNNKTEKFKNRDFIEMGLNGWHDVCFFRHSILGQGLDVSPYGWLLPPASHGGQYNLYIIYYHCNL